MGTNKERTAKPLSAAEKKLAERILAFCLLFKEVKPNPTSLLKQAAKLAKGANVEGMKEYIGELYRRGKEVSAQWYLDTETSFHLDWLEGVQVLVKIKGCYPVDEKGQKV